MPLLPKLTLNFDVDHILRAQGADPAVVRARRPALVKVAEEALQEGLPLLQPAVVYVELPVRAVRHEKIDLEMEGDSHANLSGALIVNHLMTAQKINAVLCSVGKELEKAASEKMAEDPLYGLALDAVGSAAAEALGNAVCAHFEAQAALQGLQTSLPLSPGMIDWPVSEGQPQIFKLLEKEQQQLAAPIASLSSNFVMQPRKSVSFVLGFGHSLQRQGKTCDFCAMKETCRYQDHYA